MDARLAFRLVPVFLLLLAASTALATDIVLTAFEPFGGLPINNSAEVAARLANRLQKDRAYVRAETCILPVEYDRAARAALECIGDRTPDLVLSLGAGDCSLRFETVARNWDDTGIPDNAGVLRRGVAIIPGAPDVLTLNAPMIELFRASPPTDRFRTVLSSDAGAYVCNNTAYHLAHSLGISRPTTRYGFIHVPPINCGSAAKPSALADAIEHSLRKVMPELF